MEYYGLYKFHEGTRIGALDDFFELAHMGKEATTNFCTLIPKFVFLKKKL